jgi:hypothetical protein
LKAKLTLPWILIVGLLVGLGALFLVQRKQAGDIAVLRAENDELKKSQAAAEESAQGRAKSEGDELIRLRAENEDLLRLRNEVRQLRSEKQQLNQQVQTAQAQTAQAQAAQAQLRQSLPAAGVAPPETLSQAAGARPTAGGAPGANPAENEAFRRRYGIQPTNAVPVTDAEKMNVCINNLRQIDGAKEQWALEQRKAAGTLVATTDIAPYLRGNAIPVCPAGGVYTLNPVGTAPLCTVPSHTLPK